jgi:hypothetical protein
LACIILAEAGARERFSYRSLKEMDGKQMKISAPKRGLKHGGGTGLSNVSKKVKATLAVAFTFKIW